MTYPPGEPPRPPSFTPNPQNQDPRYGQQPYGQQPQGPWPPQQPYGQNPYPPQWPQQGQQQQPGPPPRRRRRHRGLRAFAFSCAGLLVVVVAIVIATNGSKSTPGPVSATSAAAPAASPAAKPAVARTVATFTGSGIQNTPKFTVTATWKLVYSFSCAAFGSSGNFIVDEDGGNDLNGVSVNELSAGQSGSTWGYNDAGTHYLAVNSECSWKVKIIDEP